MEFNKISEKIIRPKELSYFMIREFNWSEYSTNPIAEFLKSRFFLWEEEYRNQVEVDIENTRTIVDWNFHGLYDIKKINHKNFIKVGCKEFKTMFRDFVIKEIGFDPELGKIEVELNNMIDLKSDFYIIEDLSYDYRHKWTVFDFFLSGFKVNVKEFKLTAIEFGLD
jgi:hypothetical protein